MRKTIAKAVTWRLIGTAEIFAISFWTTGHIATAGHTAGIAAISSIIMYIAHELAWEAGVKESLCPCWDDRPASCVAPQLVSSEQAAEPDNARVRAEHDRWSPNATPLPTQDQHRQRATYLAHPDELAPVE